MPRKAPPGLRKRGDVWWIWKHIGGKKVCQSTGTSKVEEAERILAHLLEEARREEIYGERPTRIWRQAAIRYLEEAEKATLSEDARQLEYLDPYIGDLPLEAVHMGNLRPFIVERKRQRKPKKGEDPKPLQKRTINAALQVVRHILNLASGEWLDEMGRPWLAHAPKIKLLRETDKKEPYPLSWDEQDRLFAELPDHLRAMALFKVNTGLRDREVCALQWDWEVDIPEHQTSVFLIPRHRVKNRQERLVVLNSIARGVIEEARGNHPVFVFVYRAHPNSPAHPIDRMGNGAWKRARRRAGLPHVRIHDLKHTYGLRLRATGVSFEDRQDLLGHKSTRITTHYSAPELLSLIQASERVCRARGDKIGTAVILGQRVRHLRAV